MLKLSYDTQYGVQYTKIKEFLCDIIYLFTTMLL